MKPRVFVETDPDRKRQLQMQLTARLPQWFAKPDSNAKYAKHAEFLDGYVAEVNHDPCGLLLLKRASAISAEIYWLAVMPAWHRQGLGRALVGAASQAARAGGPNTFSSAHCIPMTRTNPTGAPGSFIRHGVRLSSGRAIPGRSEQPDRLLHEGDCPLSSTTAFILWRRLI
jgi:GNAT superfamily N-acetyltransferase